MNIIVSFIRYFVALIFSEKDEFAFYLQLFTMQFYRKPFIHPNYLQCNLRANQTVQTVCFLFYNNQGTFTKVTEF